MRAEHVERVENTFVLSVDGAFDVLPSHGTIQNGYLRGLVELVRSRGCDPRRLLERNDIDSRTFEDPDQHTKCASAVNLLESCSGLLHDPLFGMRLAELQGPDAFGCAATLARAAPTLRVALQSLVDYVPVAASPDCEVEMVTGREVAELRWRTDTGLGDSEQVNYQGLFSVREDSADARGSPFPAALCDPHVRDCATQSSTDSGPARLQGDRKRRGARDCVPRRRFWISRLRRPIKCCSACWADICRKCARRPDRASSNRLKATCAARSRAGTAR